MSAECYIAKNIHVELISSRKDNKIMDTNDSRYKQNEREKQLLDYETMVSSAESKCSQLKGQLEKIKQFYNNQSENTKTPHSQISDVKSGRGRIGNKIMLQNVLDPNLTPGGSSEPFGNKNSNPTNMSKAARQNSQAISTDRTGAALGTINNILAGITKPMPEFYNKPEKACNFENISKSDVEQQPCPDPLHGVEEVKIYSKSRQSLCMKSKYKFTSRKSKPKVACITSSSNFKKTKKAAVKLPLSDKRYTKCFENHLKITVPVLTKRGRKAAPKQRFSGRDASKDISTGATKHTSGNPDLVEIYHNNAVKESKSSDSDIVKKKYSKADEKVKTNIELVPPLPIEENESPLLEPKGVVSCMYRNYTMPTISSRMKRVAKYYMNSFNIKSIPFCLATSTSPSHNIGINIQQVMSMVKSKQQQVGRLSPTLAYNIGLAAGKREENPLQFQISSVTSRNFYMHCPLSKNAVNYQHLQEIAKTIPQETIEEIEEDDEINSPETQSVIITGPSGDVKVTNRKQTVWAANVDEKKCTCITPKGIAFQQIINKFNGSITKSKATTTAPPTISAKIKEQKSECIASGDAIQASADCSLPLQNKERKLKEVLGKLHDEFETMTKTYDELVKQSAESPVNPRLIKQLETLDKELNGKEEEIIMVMTLYKEVLALKQQVKTLKDRASKENISFKNPLPKLNGFGYNNVSTTAGLLNKLLQRVQHFQTHYKRR